MRRWVAVALLLLAAVSGRAEEPTPKLKLDEALAGRITSLKGDLVEILYDFSDAKQMEDFVGLKPFRVAGKLEIKSEGKQVRLKGVGAFCHRIAFTGQAEIEFDVTPWTDRDFGGVVTEVGSSDQFVLYSVNDLYFQKFDGGTKPGHMICRFGIVDPSEPADAHPFRYVTRGKSPEIEKYRKIRLVAKKHGKSDEFQIADKTLKGKEPGRALNDFYVGAYIVKGTCVVDNITVRGRISPRWLEESSVVLALKDPPKPVKVSPADRAAKEKLAAFAAGKATPEELLEILSDAEVSGKIREEAAAVLAGTGNKKLVTNLVSFLYSGDVVTRKLANDIIKELTGKSFGFQAKADEEKRSKAIQKILKFLRKHAKEYQ